MDDSSIIISKAELLPPATLEEKSETSGSEMASIQNDLNIEKQHEDPSTLPQSSERLHSSTGYQEEQHRLKGFKLITVVVSLMLAVFCVALDNTIIATAIPKITDSFHTIDDVGWYGSGYLLTTCSFQILYAKFYTFFNVKWVFLVALFIFEIGSLICGIAPTSTVLIVGRAIAGLGSAGIFTGATTAVAQVAPVKLRPLITGLMGGLFGFCAVFGPLLGGIFSDKATWRWCFYINLPLGAITSMGVLAFLHVDQNLEKTEGTIIARIMQFDPIGNLLFICCVICLLLALQWGGTTYPYSDGRIIALFTLFGVLLISFIAIEVYNGERATIPSRVARQRSIRFGAFFAFCVGSTVFVIVYYLPLYFQAIRNLTPILSAVHTLPMIISQLSAVLLSGALTNRIGYYMPFIFGSAIIMPIGAGLISTFYVDMPTGKWIGYEILTGFGVGFGFQQANVAAQVVLPINDIPTGVAVVFSSLFLGGTIFLSVAENVFTNHLRENFNAAKIPGFDAEMAIKAGALELRRLIPKGHLKEALVAYNGAITKAFQVALIMSCLAILGAAGMEWKSMKATTEGDEDGNEARVGV